MTQNKETTHYTMSNAVWNHSIAGDRGGGEQRGEKEGEEEEERKKRGKRIKGERSRERRRRERRRWGKRKREREGEEEREDSRWLPSCHVPAELSAKELKGRVTKSGLIISNSVLGREPDISIPGNALVSVWLGHCLVKSVTHGGWGKTKGCSTETFWCPAGT